MFRFAAYVSAGTLSRPWHGGAVWAGMTACLNTTRIFPPLLRLLPLKRTLQLLEPLYPLIKWSFIYLFVFLTSFVCLPVCVCVCVRASAWVTVCVCEIITSSSFSFSNHVRDESVCECVRARMRACMCVLVCVYVCVSVCCCCCCYILIVRLFVNSYWDDPVWLTTR